MPVWGWFAIAAGTGLLVGVEAWAWLRHGASAVLLAIGGVLSLGYGLIVLVVVGTIGYGIVGGVTGIDPLGWFDDSTETTPTSSERECDANYEGACLDPDASDYDCAGGTGNGPHYVSGPIDVVGADPYDLDRDGNGVGCE